MCYGLFSKVCVCVCNQMSLEHSQSFPLNDYKLPVLQCKDVRPCNIIITLTKINQNTYYNYTGEYITFIFLFPFQ